MKFSLRLLILVLLAAVPVLAIQVRAVLQDHEQRKAAIAEQTLDLARLAACAAIYASPCVQWRASLHAFGQYHRVRTEPAQSWPPSLAVVRKIRHTITRPDQLRAVAHRPDPGALPAPR